MHPTSRDSIASLFQRPGTADEVHSPTRHGCHRHAVPIRRPPSRRPRGTRVHFGQRRHEAVRSAVDRDVRRPASRTRSRRARGRARGSRGGGRPRTVVRGCAGGSSGHDSGVDLLGSGRAVGGRNLVAGGWGEVGGFSPGQQVPLLTCEFDHVSWPSGPGKQGRRSHGHGRQPGGDTTTRTPVPPTRQPRMRQGPPTPDACTSALPRSVDPHRQNRRCPDHPAPQPVRPQTHEHASVLSNKVEWAISRLSNYRTVDTRHDKRACVFRGTVATAAISSWLRS